MPKPSPVGRPGRLVRPFMAPRTVCRRFTAPGFDLHAVGVSLYHLLTWRYPYGEIEPFRLRVSASRPGPPAGGRKSPGWLENILLKAVAGRRERFETEEFLLALERAPAGPWLPRAGSLWPGNPLLVENRRCRLLRHQSGSFVALCARLTAMSQALVLFAHGAAIPRGPEPCAGCSGDRRRPARHRVELAFLELMAPIFPPASPAWPARGVGCIVVLPMFIAQGGHLKRDLPAISTLQGRFPEVELQLARAVGENDRSSPRWLRRRRNCLPRQGSR